MIFLQWRMEYRKHKLNWLTCFLLVFFILFAGVIGSQIQGWDFASALHVSALFVTPLVSLLLGTTSGIGLRREDWKKWDELLPITPRRRVLSGYICSLIVGLSFFALFTFATWKTVPFLPDLMAWQDPLGDLTQIPLFFLGLLCFYLHGVGFAASYWFGSSFLGGSLSVALGGGTIVVLWWMMTTLSGYPLWTAPGNYYQIELLYPIIFLLMVVGVLTAIWFLPGIIEAGKRPGVLASLGLMVCLCLGIFSSFLIPIRVQWVDGHLLFPMGQGMNRISHLKYQGQQGILMLTNWGNLVYMSDTGERNLLYAASKPPLISNLNVYPFDIAVDSEKNVWLLADEGFDQGKRQMRLFRGTFSAPLIPYSDVLPYDKQNIYFRNRGESLSLYSEDLKRDGFYSPLPKKDQKIKWQPVSSSLSDHMIQPLVEIGQVAKLSSDGLVLTQFIPKKKTTRIWHLPAPAEAISSRQFIGYGRFHIVHSRDMVAPCAGQESEWVFPVVLQLPKKQFRLALCFPDGSIEMPWPATSQKNWQLGLGLGGALFNGGDQMRFISEVGKAFPALLSEKAIGNEVKSELYNGDDRVGPLFLLKDDRAWMGAKENLIQVDLISGKVVQKTSWRHAQADRVGYWSGFVRNKNGLYFHLNGTICRANWDGTITKFGSTRFKGSEFPNSK